MANNSGEFRKWFKGGGYWLLAGVVVCIAFWWFLLASVGWKPVLASLGLGIGAALVFGAIQEVRWRLKEGREKWRNRW